MFIEDVLKEVGLKENFLRNIVKCVNLVSYKAMVNEETSGTITSHYRLR